MCSFVEKQKKVFHCNLQLLEVWTPSIIVYIIATEDKNMFG